MKKKKPSLMSLARRMSSSPLVGFDIETTGLDRYRNDIVSVQFAYKFKGKVCSHFIWWEDYSLEEWTEFFSAIRRLPYVTHNGKFDVLFIYVKTGVFLELCQDTNVMAHVLGENELGLKPLTAKYFKDDYDVDKEIKVSGKRDKLSRLKDFITDIYVDTEVTLYRDKEEAEDFVNQLPTKSAQNACRINQEPTGWSVVQRVVHKDRTKANKLATQAYEALEGDVLVPGHGTPEAEALKEALKTLDLDILIEGLKEVTKSIVRQNNAKLEEYGKKDVIYPIKLFNLFKKKLVKEDLLKVYTYEMRAYKAYAVVEKEGIYIDPKKDQVAQELRKEYSDLLKELNTVAEINWNSGAQIGKVLFGKKNAPVTIDGEVVGVSLGLKPLGYTGKGAPKTDTASLVELAEKDPICEKLVEYKKLVKLETFINSWDELMVDGQIHPSFNITARTGRTTCSNPNLDFCWGFVK